MSTSDADRQSRAWQVISRFEREARVTSRLTSPHTVRLYDYGQTGSGDLFYAMELLHGIDFHQLVRRFGRQPQGRVAHCRGPRCPSEWP